MHQKQHTLWLLAALAAPLSHFSGSGWLSNLLAALTILPLWLLPKSWEGLSKPVVWIQILWLGIVAGHLLGFSAGNWPSNSGLAVPLTILALAALTDTASAPRLGAVLAMCMGLLAVPAAASTAARIEFRWLTPALGEWPWGVALSLLLGCLPVGRRERGRDVSAAAALAVLLGSVVQGTISLDTAASVPDPFYQTARALGHMEPILAAGITLGWYALTVRLLQSAAILAKNSETEGKKARVLLLGTAAMTLLFKVQLSATKMTVLSTFLWVLVPFLTKKEKTEKR